jgi:hypothetical protein
LDSLTSAGNEVDFISNPSVSMGVSEIKKYDKVIVGIAPPTSVAAYKIYPAFAIASKAWKIGNLELFMDAPEPHKLQAAINSCHSGKSSLSKDFFSRRKGYSEYVSNSNNVRENVDRFIDLLATEKWPNTYYPAFPWCTPDEYQSSLSVGGCNIIPLYPDSWMLSKDYVSTKDAMQSTYWTADTTSTPWFKELEKHLTSEVVLSQQGRKDTEQETVDRVRGSIGSIVSVYRQGQPWWSPLLAYSLSVDVPVVTDWRLTEYMGSEWAMLATTVEDLSHSMRYELAEAQKTKYLRYIPPWERQAERLNDIISGRLIVSAMDPKSLN